MTSARRACGSLTTLLALALLASAALAPAGEASDPSPFTGRGLRYDYYHSAQFGRGHSAQFGRGHSAQFGRGHSEIFSPDGVCLEGVWAGPANGVRAPLDRGAYRYELVDAESSQLLHAEGFGSIYDEWRTTREALDGGAATFHESFRFPEPRKPALIRILRRDASGKGFQLRHEYRFEPGPLSIDASPPPRRDVRVRTLFENGGLSDKVDLLVLGDGYTEGDEERFFDEARRHVEALFAVEPFKRRRGDFNARALMVAAESPGIRDPRRGRWRSSALGLSYNALGSDRYVLTMRNRTLREFASNAPYDALVLLFNERKYGGGGIYNLWATVAARTSVSEYVFIHELGHSFAGLADEYYTSQVAYEDLGDPGVEPWEPNVTAHPERGALKWRDLVAEDTPLPTPWPQARFDELSLAYQEKRAQLSASGGDDDAMEALFEAVRETTGALLSKAPHAGEVGAFQGAAYRAEGLYRPAIDCIMFSRNPSSFCPVCERAIEESIDAHISPRSSASRE